ncbi:MAG: sarcosine oxidase subunit delta, partial [Acidobacteria bacterium]|nr:sarcosine oxidase subunit delta [Acidobacteriota bacterium]
MMQLECPNCGPRNVSEFRFRGEYVERPRDGADPAQRRAWA